MTHRAIDQVLARAEHSKQDSDFTYFFDLLLAAEATAKLVTLGMLAALAEDKDRNQYRLEHMLVRADGLGDWGRALEDILSGPASQFLLTDAHSEQTQLTQLVKEGAWQFACVREIKAALQSLNIESEEVPARTDLKRFFRLLATLRNKTRAHGATKASGAGAAAIALRSALDTLHSNFSLFSRPWAYLHRNLSGKYRISPIAGDCTPFEFLKRETNHNFANGIYVFWQSPKLVRLADSDPELDDFFISNGGFGAKRFELISYRTDNRIEGDSSHYSLPPGTLPQSETSGTGELLPRGKILTNAPPPIDGYIRRPKLESELRELILDDRRPVVTLRGRGGIGKTSLALTTLQDVAETERFVAVVWLSSRDVDLLPTGPKAVRPEVISAEDVSKLYARLVLPASRFQDRAFQPVSFFESQLNSSEVGPTLFVFDNFETIGGPVEAFTWIDTYIRLPNKVLITTRLRDFKGDYPVDVLGMSDEESRKLIKQTADYLGLNDGLTETYISEIIKHSGGHPYVIKILLGEYARTGHARNIPQLIAGSEEILTALFERTYSAISPCAQRAFLTMSAWNSAIPRLALEAVLLRSTGERSEVETGIESLIQYSMAESNLAPADGVEFLSLPLVASTFGRKKLNISPQRISIESDVELLRLLGPSVRDDVHLGLARKMENLISGIAKRVDAGESFESYASLLEMMCRSYAPAWLLLARWHCEQGTTDSFERAKVELRRFLEGNSNSAQASEAWRLLAFACYRTGDALGEIHAFVERSQLSHVSFYEISTTANRLNDLLRSHTAQIDPETKRGLAGKLLGAMRARKNEAEGDDLSRMAWLSIHIGNESDARQYTEEGLRVDPSNYHCQKLANRLGM